MRILQLIDSLEPGGAERIAVNYANANAKAAFSALVATRKEGELKSKLLPNVHYLFLDRKSTLDFGAVFRLRKFCAQHSIEFLHAHSSSFLIAFFVKLTMPKLRILWHDHDGMSEFLEQRRSYELKITSPFFSGIISVNHKLKVWAEKKLHCKNVIYLPNFMQPDANSETVTKLNGIQGQRILCLANLRPQKNHPLLVQVAKILCEEYPQWSFHLVGKDFKDDYSSNLQQSIVGNSLQEQIYLYDSRNDIGAIIKQADIAVLTSTSEGLPVSLLEYGYYEKPVVVTAVGEIPSIVVNRKNGMLVNNGDLDGFTTALCELIENENLRREIGINLKATIENNFSETAISQQYFQWLSKL